MKKDRLYLLLSLGLLGGYAYMAYSVYYPEAHVTACFFKSVTGIPCPACGNTRSVLAFLRGDPYSALCVNPLGVIMALLMIVLPAWIIFDIVAKKETLYYFYKKAEKTIALKPVAIIFVLLIVMNWIWNIKKGL